MRQVLGPDALARPREIGWRGGIGMGNTSYLITYKGNNTSLIHPTFLPYMGNTCNSMADSYQCMTKPNEML